MKIKKTYFLSVSLMIISLFIDFKIASADSYTECSGTVEPNKYILGANFVSLSDGYYSVNYCFKNAPKRAAKVCKVLPTTSSFSTGIFK